MKLSDITIGKVQSFIQGYSRYYYDNIFGMPSWIKEQVFFRLFTCKDSCLITGACKKCTCPTIKKAYATASCNEEEFPDLMPAQEWEDYKKANNITGLNEMREEVEALIYNSENKDV